MHETATTLRHELRQLHAAGHTSPNQVQFTTASGPTVATKPNVFEADLHARDLRARCPAFSSLFDALASEAGGDASEGLRSVLESTLGTSYCTGGSQWLARGERSFTLKLQVRDVRLSGSCLEPLATAAE